MSDKPRFDAIIEVYDSSFIKGVVYDHTRLTMDIEFGQRATDVAEGSSRLYRYRGVTPLEFVQLITSRSTGQTFNAVFRGKKKSTKLKRDKLV